jgi:tetratricopeptide (TPR) repeat protein
LRMLKGERQSLTASYRRLAKNAGQPKLLAYVLCDLGEILMDRETWRTTRKEGKEVLERALSLLPKIDPKIISAYIHLRGYYLFRGHWDEAMAMSKKQLQLFLEANDELGVTQALRDEAFAYGWMGYWRKAIDLHEQVRERLLSQASSESLRANMHMRPWYLIGSGRYKDAETGLREAIEIYTRIGNQDLAWIAKRDLALTLALQDRFEYGRVTFQKVHSHFQELGRKGEMGIGFWGIAKAREGDFVEAKKLFLQSWQIKQEIEDVLGYQEALYNLGYVSELDSLQDRTALSKAEAYYLQALSYKRYGRHHDECAALTGLVRVKHAQEVYDAISPLLAKAEQLAQQYEYNDHLASLQLTQGHVAWEGRGEVTLPLQRYQYALIYALRYNRFLLDEVLIGRPQGTPLRPIIPYCLERGEEGRWVLIALRDWWKTGFNNIGIPRSDTISPIFEGIPLLEAEHIAREREPGDGSPQKSVVKQIEATL